MISAVLITFNEENVLKRCLESIKDFVSEIIIVDLGSKDGSLAVAKEYKAKIFNHPWVPYADPVRNFALEKVTGQWVLMLDPDEVVPKTLQDKLQGLIKSQEPFAAVNIPFKNIFFGKWISHTNFWPDKHLRFFKAGTVKWQDQVHSYPKVIGKVLELPAEEKYAVLHNSYKSWSEFYKKQKKYALSEAKNRKLAGEGFSIKRLIWLPLREFLARFIKHRGFLDGINGLFLVLVLMWYRVLVEWYLIKISNTK